VLADTLSGTTEGLWLRSITSRFCCIQHAPRNFLPRTRRGARAAQSTNEAGARDITCRRARRASSKIFEGWIFGARATLIVKLMEHDDGEHKESVQGMESSGACWKYAGEGGKNAVFAYQTNTTPADGEQANWLRGRLLRVDKTDLSKSSSQHASGFDSAVKQDPAVAVSWRRRREAAS